MTVCAAYYNEKDAFSAAWLRELIKAGLIAPGEVDERDIWDVVPTDLSGFVQCHFFAGIGVWSYALRCAGWPDDRPVWTGSCPCQPFSAAGEGKGFADERHLWPVFFHLVRACRPHVIFGEQVASNLGLAWFDLVCADLESEKYACGAVDSCAAGFGAPHIRQRLYWLAYPKSGQQRWIWEGRPSTRSERKNRGCCTTCGVAHTTGQRYARPKRDAETKARLRVPGAECGACGLDNPFCAGLEGHAGHGADAGGRADAFRPASTAGISCGLEDASSNRRHAGRHNHGQDDRRQPCAAGENLWPGSGDGFWRAADWLCCTDGKWRPVEPGLEPLAHGAAARVGRLRGYGNALCAPQAEAFIRAYLGAEQDLREF